MKAKCFSTFGFALEGEFKKNIEVWIDRAMDTNNPINKIFVCIEPNEVSRINSYLKERHSDFDFILTYDEELLDSLPNAILFEYGTTWINKDFEFLEKDPSLSFVCNNKMHCKGHRLRQKIWHNQDKISFNKKFFIGTRNAPQNDRTIINGIEPYEDSLYLGDCKYPLFNSMFHVCIENVSKKYFFTEKLIDCFLTKTIPIYWGCSNIGDYFNTDGMIMFQDHKDFFDKCNSLNKEVYSSKERIVEENFEKAQKYINYPGRLEDKIRELYKI